jgi:hypothetical protein
MVLDGCSTLQPVAIFRLVILSFSVQSSTLSAVSLPLLWRVTCLFPFISMSIANLERWMGGFRLIVPTARFR